MVLSTRWLTRPLRQLAEAARRHSIGDSAAPLPSSGLTEIARLASAFQLVQDEVINRTAERDRADGLERRFRGLLESAPDATVIADDRGCIQLVNRQESCSSDMAETS